MGAGLIRWASPRISTRVRAKSTKMRNIVKSRPAITMR